MKIQILSLFFFFLEKNTPEEGPPHVFREYTQTGYI